MKKYIFILLALVALGTIQANAQRNFQKKFSNAGVPFYVTSDTVTNTGTNYLSTIQPIGGPASTCTIQWTGTRQSGTVAGTVTLQGSLDAVSWTTVTGTSTGVQTGAFTATNVATQATTWTLVGNPFPYYRVTWTGSGTMAATQTAVAVCH